jgi:hypothetical protein
MVHNWQLRHYPARSDLIPVEILGLVLFSVPSKEMEPSVDLPDAEQHPLVSLVSASFWVIRAFPVFCAHVL